MSKVTYVRWVDSASELTSAWVTLEGAKKCKLAVCESVGWVVEECDDRIVLAADRGAHDGQGGEVGRVMVIPKSCIVKRGTL